MSLSAYQRALIYNVMHPEVVGADGVAAAIRHLGYDPRARAATVQPEQLCARCRKPYSDHKESGEYLLCR